MITVTITYNNATLVPVTERWTEEEFTHSIYIDWIKETMKRPSVKRLDMDNGSGHTYVFEKK